MRKKKNEYFIKFTYSAKRERFISIAIHSACCAARIINELNKKHINFELVDIKKL